MNIPEEHLPLLRHRQTKEQRIALAMLLKLEPRRVKSGKLPHTWKGEKRTFDGHRLTRYQCAELGANTRKITSAQDRRVIPVHELRNKGVSRVIAEHIYDGNLLQMAGERFLAGTLEPKDPTLLLAGSVELGHIEKEEEVLNDQHVYHRAAAEYMKALMKHRQWVQLEYVTPLGAHVVCCDGIPHNYLFEQFEETFLSTLKHQFFIEYDTQASAYHYFSGKALVEGIPAETDDPQALLIYTAIHAQFSKDESCLPQKKSSSSSEKTAEDQSISQKTSIPSLT